MTQEVIICIPIFHTILTFHGPNLISIFSFTIYSHFNVLHDNVSARMPPKIGQLMIVFSEISAILFIVYPRNHRDAPWEIFGGTGSPPIMSTCAFPHLSCAQCSKVWDGYCLFSFCLGIECMLGFLLMGYRSESFFVRQIKNTKLSQIHLFFKKSSVFLHYSSCDHGPSTWIFILQETWQLHLLSITGNSCPPLGDVWVSRQHCASQSQLDIYSVVDID